MLSVGEQSDRVEMSRRAASVCNPQLRVAIGYGRARVGDGSVEPR
jgi:hypothetical protein